MLDHNTPHNTSAILVIDMQNDFVHANGALHVAGAATTVHTIASFLEYGREKGWPVIHVIRKHNASGADAEPFRKHLFTEGKGFCVEGSWGAEIVEGLQPAPNDIVIAKLRFSAFFGTALDSLLRDLGIKHLYLTGTQYPNCIRATAVDAISLDYPVTVVTDCCSAKTKDVALANIRDMLLMGIECVDSYHIKY